MATQAKIPIIASRTVQGTPVPRLEVPEKATQTFKKGALVYVDSTGFLTECGADPALILGIASRDGQSGATDGAKLQIVDLAYPGTVFRGYLDTSAGEGTGVTAATDRLKAYGVAKSASGGIWYVDKADTTADRVVIWEFYQSVESGVLQAVGDIRHHVFFTFLHANCQACIGT